MDKKRQRRWVIAIVAVSAVVVSYVAMRRGLAPMPSGPASYVRFEKSVTLPEALALLQTNGVVRDPFAIQILSVLERHSQKVTFGTYQVQPGMSGSEILKVLSHPIRWMIRIPEQNWARRTANLLQKKEVLNADGYMDLVANPDAFRSEVAFPIEGTTLEGYLYPDTYAMAPLTPPREIIDRQLKNFQKKVWEPLGQPANLRRVLTVASMVELEVARDEERPIVAGVIENRIAKGMPLQIDATVCYARQKWGKLSLADLRNIKSPYNTYLNKGLPPGPICSPSVKSIEAALHPAKHAFLYYVAMPDGHQLFAQTLAEHEVNVKKRRHLLALAAKEQP